MSFNKNIQIAYVGPSVYGMYKCKNDFIFDLT